MKKRLAVFASGTGTNFDAIARACADGVLNAEVAVMVCDKPGAAVIEKAERYGVDTFVFSPKSYPSKAAFETLAIIAYRQPCTVPEAEAVRGVAVGGPVKTLMDRGLIKEAGRRNTPGKPMQYTTTPEFLEYFGLNTIDDLPDIDEIKKTVSPEPDTITLL